MTALAVVRGPEGERFEVRRTLSVSIKRRTSDHGDQDTHRYTLTLSEERVEGVARTGAYPARRGRTCGA